MLLEGRQIKHFFKVKIKKKKRRGGGGEGGKDLLRKEHGDTVFSFSKVLQQ